MAWTLRRIGAQRPIVLALACVTAVAAFLLAAIAGYNQRAQIVGIHDYLAAVPADSGALQIQATLSKDALAQQQAASRLFGTAVGDLPLEVHRSVRTAPIALAVEPVGAGPAEGGDEPAAAPTVRLASFEGLDAHAQLLAGAWPEEASAAPWPAVIEDSVADTWGLAVGDSVRTAGSSPLDLVVAGIWSPRVTGDPYFDADAAGARSVDELVADRASVGFIAVATGAIGASGAKPIVTWTVMPRADGVLPGDLAAMSEAVAGLPDAVVADRTAAPTGAVAAGHLSRTLDVVIASVVSASAVGVIPGLTVAAIALMMVIQLARLLAWQRRADTALVRSRGASTGRLLRVAAAEAALITMPSLVVAAGGAILLGAVLDVRVPVQGWIVAIACALTAGLIIVIPAAHQARLPANRQLIDDSGRIGTAVASGAVAVTCLIAAVAWWRFDRAGSALIATEHADAHLDPIAVIAPPAVLIAAAMVAWVAFAACAGLAELLTRRASGAWLVSRDLARRATVFGIIVVLVAIALGSVGMAAVYAPTQRAAQQQANILENGAPLRVQLPATDQLRPGAHERSEARLIAEAAGTNRVIPGIQRTVAIGDADPLLTAVPLIERGVLPSIPGSFDPQELAGALSDGGAGAVLPDGTDSVTASVVVSLAWARPGPTISRSDGPPIQEPGEPGPSGQAAEASITVWILDADGSASPVAASELAEVPIAPRAPGVPQEENVTVALPDLAPGARVVGFELALPSAPYPLDVEFQVTALDAIARGATIPIDLTTLTWNASPQPRVGNAGVPQLLDYELRSTGVGVSGSLPASQANIARIGATPAGPLAVAINPVLADQLDLAVGDEVDMGLSATRVVPVRIAVVSPLLPGRADQPAVFADYTAMELALLGAVTSLPGPDQVWIAPDDVAAASAAVRSVIPPTASITPVDTLSVGALADPAGITLWVGAIAALALATVAVGSVVAGQSRSRRGDPVVLRASGMTIRSVARQRRAELWATLAAAWIFGAAAAVVGVILTGRTLAGSGVVGLHGSRPVIHADLITAGVVLGAHALVVLAIVAVYSRQVRRRARESSPSELVM